MIKDITLDELDYRVSISEDLKGIKVPRWKYFGVTAAHANKDGTIRYRAHINYKDDFNKNKLKSLGFFNSELEAALYRDKYIDEHNIRTKKNFDEEGNVINYGQYVPRDIGKIIGNLLGILSIEDISSITKTNKASIRNYIKNIGLSPRTDGSYLVLIDKRDNYDS